MKKVGRERLRRLLTTAKTIGRPRTRTKLEKGTFSTVSSSLEQEAALLDYKTRWANNKSAASAHEVVDLVWKTAAKLWTLATAVFFLDLLDRVCVVNE